MKKPTKKASDMTPAERARYIDQSVLSPWFTQEQIRQYIQDGVKYGCATVCVNPASLDIAAELTAGTDTKICVVCDFPFGLSTTQSKVMQAEEYCKRGDIYELDIVANYGWTRSGMYDAVYEDIKSVCDVCHKYGTAVKVILETDALTSEQVEKSAEAVVRAGADFLKSCTGFYTGGPAIGATPELVETMLRIGGDQCQVKGSGMIRTREHFFQLIDMGIDRMGIHYAFTPMVIGLCEEAQW